MSKRGYISRYLLILKFLKANPFCSFEDILSYFTKNYHYWQMQDESLNIGFSKRTFQRDIHEISNMFGIDIEYSKSQRGYFIAQEEMENLNFQRMLESFDLFNSLNLSSHLKNMVLLEKQPPLGTQNLYEIIHAIKNQRRLKFHHQKFEDEQQTIRTVEPLALKEFKKRWYLLGKDLADQKIKTFGLDRISDLELLKSTFLNPDFNPNEYFQYCYGITKPENQSPQEIILSFDAEQGKYIKSLPIHETQEIISESKNNFTVKLKLYITFDLLMELMSYSVSLTVIKPKSLATKLKKLHINAAENYK